MRILLMLSMLLAGHALGEPRPAPYLEAQAFLAGSCWKGTFPDGKRTDEHCFEWIYGGQYLRDRHVVAGGPSPYGGETIYFFDASSKTVQYLYINTLGGASRGSVAVRDGALVFPEDKYSDGKQEQTYRSAWRRDGDDAYFVLTEVRSGDGWKEAWRIRMERQK